MSSPAQKRCTRSTSRLRRSGPTEARRVARSRRSAARSRKNASSSARSKSGSSPRSSAPSSTSSTGSGTTPTGSCLRRRRKRSRAWATSSARSRRAHACSSRRTTCKRVSAVGHASRSSRAVILVRFAAARLSANIRAVATHHVDRAGIVDRTRLRCTAMTSLLMCRTKPMDWPFNIPVPIN